MLVQLNSALGVPIYIQLMEQIKHAVEVGALKAGQQLPAIRALAEDLVTNPNTVAKAYRELQHEGIIEVRHGSGAFVSERAEIRSARDTQRARSILETAIERLGQLGLAEDEMRRLFENELLKLRDKAPGKKEL